MIEDSIAGAIASGLVGAVTGWLSSRRMFYVRQGETKVWRASVNKKFETLFKFIDMGDTRVQAERLTTLKARVDSLERFKEENLTRILEDVRSDVFGTIGNHRDEMNRRIERLERRVFHVNDSG